MTIKVWDYLAELDAERDDIMAGIDKVLRSGRLILGDSVRGFEQAFAAYCGSAHGVGVDNATNGLVLALRALGIGAGDEVLTVANTAVPTVSAIVTAGATPRFVDVDPATALMDVGQLAAAVGPRTRCILPVHLYGQCCDMQAIGAIAGRHELAVVEDCSQSHGATQRGAKAGSFGDCGVFSFYPTKPLGTFGDGGLITTSRAPIDARLRRLRFYGMDTQYYAEEHGYNARLDELHAEILLRKLARLEGYIARRRALAARYQAGLAGTGLVLPHEFGGNRHVYYVYVVRHPQRERLMAHLARHDIATNISYPYPIHTMRGYASLGGKAGDLPVTERLCREIFSLPMYPGLTDDEQERVIEVLRDALEHVPAPE